MSFVIQQKRWVALASAGPVVLLILLGCRGGAGSATPLRCGQVRPVERQVWTHLTYDSRGLLQFKYVFSSADQERALAFFGPTTNKLENIMLPLCEGLLTRVHETSLYAQRTNTAKRAYRLVYWPNQKPPTILHGERLHRACTLRVYRWAQETSPCLEESPLTTDIQLPSSAWPMTEETLARTHFWEQPHSIAFWEVKDGYHFLLEVLDRGRYRLVYRAAEEDEEIEKLCWNLLKTAPEL